MPLQPATAAAFASPGSLRSRVAWDSPTGQVGRVACDPPRLGRDRRIVDAARLSRSDDCRTLAACRAWLRVMFAGRRADIRPLEQEVPAFRLRRRSTFHLLRHATFRRCGRRRYCFEATYRAECPADGRFAVIHAAFQPPFEAVPRSKPCSRAKTARPTCNFARLLFFRTALA